MCRNIRPLANFEPPVTDDEVHAAALQYVRKISGTARPSQANAEVFDRAVAEVAEASARLLAALVTTAPPKDREEEAAKARRRAALRYGSTAAENDHARSSVDLGDGVERLHSQTSQEELSNGA
jgi:hypothetical protein